MAHRHPRFGGPGWGGRGCPFGHGGPAHRPGEEVKEEGNTGQNPPVVDLEAGAQFLRSVGESVAAALGNLGI